MEELNVKKLLGILGSVGLVATSGATVVSCKNGADDSLGNVIGESVAVNNLEVTCETFEDYAASVEVSMAISDELVGSDDASGFVGVHLFDSEQKAKDMIDLQRQINQAAKDNDISKMAELSGQKIDMITKDEYKGDSNEGDVLYYAYQDQTESTDPDKTGMSFFIFEGSVTIHIHNIANK
jgi:hypothetical protein